MIRGPREAVVRLSRALRVLDWLVLLQFAAAGGEGETDEAAGEQEDGAGFGGGGGRADGDVVGVTVISLGGVPEADADADVLDVEAAPEDAGGVFGGGEVVESALGSGRAEGAGGEAGTVADDVEGGGIAVDGVEGPDVIADAGHQELDGQGFLIGVGGFDGEEEVGREGGLAVGAHFPGGGGDVAEFPAVAGEVLGFPAGVGEVGVVESELGGLVAGMGDGGGGARGAAGVVIEVVTGSFEALGVDDSGAGGGSEDGERQGDECDCFQYFGGQFCVPRAEYNQRDGRNRGENRNPVSSDAEYRNR